MLLAVALLDICEHFKQAPHLNFAQGGRRAMGQLHCHCQTLAFAKFAVAMNQSTI